MEWRSVLYAGWILAVAAQPVWGQRLDGDVLRPGEFRLTGQAEMWHVDSRFTDDGSSGLAPELEVDLTPTAVAGFDVIQTLLTSFFEETSDVAGAMPADPSALTAGTLSLDPAFSVRYLPIRLAAGILPRLEIGVQLPVYRTERLFRDYTTSGGNVGSNPAAEANGQLLAGRTESAGALGAAPLLPLAGTPLADELQRRVLALTGGELDLPTAPISALDLRPLFNSLPPSGYVSLWHPGDLEIDARFRLLSSFGSAPFPEPGATGSSHRLTAFAAIRLPTGRATLPDYGIGTPPPAGHAGATVGATGDLFLGERVWISGGGTYRKLGAAAVQAFAPGEGGPFAAGSALVTIDRSPGDETELWILPRFRLTPTISFGPMLRSERRSEGTESVEDIDLQIDGGSRHSAGFFLRYSMLPTSPEGGLDAEIGYTAAFAGSAGLEVPSVSYLRISLNRRIFGGGS
jgi:hypothetical protein